MSHLYRLSLIRLWPVLNKANRQLSSQQKTLITKITQTRICCYCKRYGLYDEEEDTYGEYNRRGAYIEKHRNSFTGRVGALDQDNYDNDDFSGSVNQRGRRPPNFQRQPRGYQREFFEESRHGLRDNEEYDDDGGDYSRVPQHESYSSRGAQHESYNSHGASYAKRPTFRGNEYGPPRSSNMYGRPYAHGRGQSKYDMFMDEGDLPKQNFNPSNVPPINKNLYKEHPDVAQRSMEEIEEYRNSFNMSVKGRDIPKPITSFNELEISEHLSELIKSQNFPNPTPIQSQGWPIALSGRDMIGISQTGSGKTLVFILPAMIHIMNQPIPKHMSQFASSPQVLVLAPTRELAQQINVVSSNFKHSCGITTSCVYGGASKPQQLHKMQGTQICVATPGRLLDFLREGSVSLTSCTYLVLDEADRMLDMGFEPQIRRIISQIRPDRQTLMWSATWPKEVQTLAEDFLTDYVHVTIGSEDLSANPNIEQNIYVMSEFDKSDRLLSLLKSINGSEQQSKILIFAQTKRTVDYLEEKLNRQRISAMSIHGDVSQSRRDRVLDRFRNQKSSILIATDVAARGLDVDDIHHIINYDFPQNIDDYIHRIGRTARGNKTGTAHSFFTRENAGIVKDLVNVLNKVGQPVPNELLQFVSRGNFGSRSRFNIPGRNRYQGRNAGW